MTTPRPYTGALELLRAAKLRPTRLIAVDGAGHDLKRGRFDLDAIIEGLAALAR